VEWRATHSASFTLLTKQYCKSHDYDDDDDDDDEMGIVYMKNIKKLLGIG